uniref:Uncharacterized GPI-anchored protein At5g19230-like domain-containing protein n=1 Tax=Kalanchoe fedtschenkoi TaxID=63787 RepID=A0A7N0V405_KALFE
MASTVNISLFVSLLLVLTVTLLLSSSPVHCKSVDEDRLLQGINNYRLAQKLPVLKENDEADCLADEIADSLENHPCSRPVSTNFADYQKQLNKCKVDINSTRDAVILPACVPHLVSTQVLANYTQNPPITRSLNDTKYANIGLGSEDDWMVVVLSTTTPTGSLANAAGRRLVASIGVLGLLAIQLLLLA